MSVFLGDFLSKLNLEYYRLPTKYLLTILFLVFYSHWKKLLPKSRAIFRADSFNTSTFICRIYIFLISSSDKSKLSPLMCPLFTGFLYVFLIFEPPKKSLRQFSITVSLMLFVSKLHNILWRFLQVLRHTSDLGTKRL